MQFSLDDLTIQKEWEGIVDEVNSCLSYGQEQYVKQQVRLLWRIWPLHKIAASYIKLLHSKAVVEYGRKYNTDTKKFDKIMTVKQKVALVACNVIAAYIFLKEPKLPPQ
jgi:hypothetical protein